MAGRVDSRLLLALALLAGREPVDIVRFGTPGPGASSGVPLRVADLAGPTLGGTRGLVQGAKLRYRSPFELGDRPSDEVEGLPLDQTRLGQRSPIGRERSPASGIRLVGAVEPPRVDAMLERAQHRVGEEREAACHVAIH